jgi:hypothetical protein
MRQIGNAVPVRLANIIGVSVANQLERMVTQEAKRRNLRLKPFNPLDKRKLGESVADKLLEMTAQPLPPEPFIGAGEYALYYTVSYSAYGRLSEVNCDGQFRCSNYVGKAVPEGTSKGGLGPDVDH